MKAGTQFVWVPTHAHGDISHADCRRGFIARDEQLGQSVFVYFWDVVGVSLCTDRPAITDSSRLVAVDSCEQGVVDGLIGR
jgi:hypothetical protein